MNSQVQILPPLSVMTTNTRRLLGTEHQEQCVVIKWACYREMAFPELKLLHSSTNGVHANSVQAVMKLKREGMKNGIPDLHLPVPKGEYVSLYIEMKVRNNKPTTDQLTWIEQLRLWGNRVEVCYGASEAIAVLIDYLGITTENHGVQGHLKL